MRQREIDRQLAIILKQPTAEHDARLTQVATRLGEDLKGQAIEVSSSLARQQWLEAVVEALRAKFADVGYTIPEKVRVSIGWPKRAASCGAIGECWATEASSDRHAEVFVSPELTDGARIVDVLAHELAGGRGLFGPARGRVGDLIQSPQLFFIARAWPRVALGSGLRSVIW